MIACNRAAPFLSHRRNRRTPLFNHSRAPERLSESDTWPDRRGGNAAPKARCCRESSCRSPPAARSPLGQAGPMRGQGPIRERLYSIAGASAPARRRWHRLEPAQKKPGGPAKDGLRRCHPNPATLEPARRCENCPGGSRHGPTSLEGRKPPPHRTDWGVRAQNPRA